MLNRLSSTARYPSRDRPAREGDISLALGAGGTTYRLVVSLFLAAARCKRAPRGERYGRPSGGALPVDIACCAQRRRPRASPRGDLSISGRLLPLAALPVSLLPTPLQQTGNRRSWCRKISLRPRALAPLRVAAAVCAAPYRAAWRTPFSEAGRRRNGAVAARSALDAWDAWRANHEANYISRRAALTYRCLRHWRRMKACAGSFLFTIMQQRHLGVSCSACTVLLHYAHGAKRQRPSARRHAGGLSARSKPLRIARRALRPPPSTAGMPRRASTAASPLRRFSLPLRSKTRFTTLPARRCSRATLRAGAGRTDGCSMTATCWTAGLTASKISQHLCWRAKQRARVWRNCCRTPRMAG